MRTCRHLVRIELEERVEVISAALAAGRVLGGEIDGMHLAVAAAMTAGCMVPMNEKTA